MPPWSSVCGSVLESRCRHKADFAQPHYPRANLSQGPKANPTFHPSFGPEMLVQALSRLRYVARSSLSGLDGVGLSQRSLLRPLPLTSNFMHNHKLLHGGTLCIHIW
ncbi:uncharacterized protein CIMG_13758 [Coccidioides immitis RS]|uniref:Uncharacterized protein n=1 Tax=Coccidioides immitis (strain RS) TaxID=246410 RepID=A0A0D8JXD1_COCIM|nr:uncharacterized protein CIMG_13758 [Coccidioides immitis RS]KJF61591.1 hypothetical protein CIMG_13758 [Coccidioides immitis RS]